MKKFDLHKSFRLGSEMVHAGVYRVPQDMTPEAAAKAARDGLGEWVPVAPAKAEKFVPPARGGRGGHKNLGGTPENKSQGGQAATATFPSAGADEKLD